MTEHEHTYPPDYPPGTTWAITEAWRILDAVRPGVIDHETRAFLAGCIAGTLGRIYMYGPELLTRGRAMTTHDDALDLSPDVGPVPWLRRQARAVRPCVVQAVPPRALLRDLARGGA